MLPEHTCTIRVAIAEDHLLMREGIRALLKEDSVIEWVGQAADGLEAVEMVEKLKPDVLLLDLRIPRLHGIEVLRQLKTRGEQTKVVVLTMHQDEPYIIEALKSGVSGYVLKDSSKAELVDAIKIAAAGGQYICQGLRQKAVRATLKRVLPGTCGPQLTKRELQVLELAAEGKTSAEISTQLFISRRTAEAHRANVMKKLGLKTQTDLVLYAVRTGMISP